MIICEAADALFKWDDFALDLYFAERDEVFSLLNITTVEGQRVEIPAALQPKTANALIRRVMQHGRGIAARWHEAKNYSAATMLAPVRSGAQVIGVLFIQSHAPRRLLAKRTWKCCKRWPTSAAARWIVSAPASNCSKASGASAICLKIRRTPFSSRT